MRKPPAGAAITGVGAFTMEVVIMQRDRIHEETMAYTALKDPDYYCPECGKQAETVYKESIYWDIIGCENCCCEYEREHTALMPEKCPNCGENIEGENFITTTSQVAIACSMCCTTVEAWEVLNDE